jgi:hypothetical protein
MEQALVNLAPVLFNFVSGEQTTPLGLLQVCARHAMKKWERFENRTPLLMIYIHLAVKYAYLAGQTEMGLGRGLEALQIPPLGTSDYSKYQQRRLQMLQIIRNNVRGWQEPELVHFWAAYERKYFPLSENPL